MKQPVSKKQSSTQILQQCRKWHKNNEHEKIIDALEAIPASKRTPEMDSELAQAYNFLADLSRPESRKWLKRSIDLLEPHEEYFASNYSWNFRMGYAYYYLDQFGRALPYFQTALDARPRDKDAENFIRSCDARITLPRFQACFRKRTESAWKRFCSQEAQLRRLLDENKYWKRGRELIDRVEEILNLVFDDIYFGIEVGDKKHKLILCPQDNKIRLFELVYFRKHAPEDVLEHWDIQIGREPFENNVVCTDDGLEISDEDVQVWLEEYGEERFTLYVYSEKLLPLFREDEEETKWAITTLTDQALGDVNSVRYIHHFEMLQVPRSAPSIPMSSLLDTLREKGLETSNNPEDCLENFFSYVYETKEDPELDWRLDVLTGFTRCESLDDTYLDADVYLIDKLEADGAVGGFFCYPLDSLGGDLGDQKISDFQNKFLEALLAGDGPEELTITGGAIGLYHCYVDFIAWDLMAVMDKAMTFFADMGIPWFGFQTFRRDANPLILKRQSEEEANDVNQDDK